MIDTANETKKNKKDNSDPICSSAGCNYPKKEGHPVDYQVPNFGPDHDIVST